jgi:2-dehydro-3-deoxygalactonokinase
MTPFCAAIDWGTSAFRLWIFAGDGTVLAERRSDDGMFRAADDGFAVILERHLAELGVAADLPAIICGMAGARQGWREAGYLDTPCNVADIIGRALRVDDHPRDVRILPGIAQRDARAPDVLRGEETQLLGLVAEGLRSGVVCMPGTHSKWVTLGAGKVESFSTYMTGELFAVLSRCSILGAAMTGGVDVSPDSPAFLAAAASVLDSRAPVSNLLFQVRAGQLLGFAPPAEGAARLSGLLIGLELAGAVTRLGAGTEIVLAASGGLGALYQAVMEARGLTVRVCEADIAVRRGLWSAARAIWGTHGKQSHAS